ncbi:hypothetical protein GDO86_015648 [Hymenochirus boettgeri]|nr:hypothetical protein GDO86_015648 [Hymenochirus boettgeri]
MSFCWTSSSTQDCNGNCSLTKTFLGQTSFFSTQKCDSNCVPTNASTDNVFSLQYTKTCCLTDLCNGGNSAKVSLSLGLGVFLMWLLKAM